MKWNSCFASVISTFDLNQFRDGSSSVENVVLNPTKLIFEKEVLVINTLRFLLLKFNPVEIRLLGSCGVERTLVMSTLLSLYFKLTD